MLSIPFKQGWLPNWGAWGAPIFEAISAYIAVQILGFSTTLSYQLSSDSTGLYIHLLFVAILAIHIALIWQYFSTTQWDDKVPRYWFRTGVAHFLSLHLLAYGASKIFKVQFFLPEPNTLYTPLGQLSKDLLFWSSMGSAYGYTLFSGLVEIIPALLLLHRKTRLLGALVAFGVMTNVVAINFGFDISVKIFSCFLLYLSGLLLSPAVLKSYRFFILEQSTQLSFWRPQLAKTWYIPIKLIVILILLGNALIPYIQTGNFNDDLATRPLLHGAYEVEDFVWDGEERPVNLEDPLRWRRIFVHRRGYLIVQNMQDQFYDFALKVDWDKQTLYLDGKSGQAALSFEFQEGQFLRLFGQLQGHQLELNGTVLDWKQLPLLKPQFHWSIDDI